jgi:putative PIN family toxin of toxin-antitoxin system
VNVFFDTNVWLASLISRGLCADLVRASLAAHDARNIQVLTCSAVMAETHRLLEGRFFANDAQLAAAQEIFDKIERVPDGAAALPPGFPDPDDWPIVAGAIAAGADMFVTGDKALLALEAIQELAIVDPRTAYRRLKGLE